MQRVVSFFDDIGVLWLISVLFALVIELVIIVVLMFSFLFQCFRDILVLFSEEQSENEQKKPDAD